MSSPLMSSVLVSFSIAIEQLSREKRTWIRLIQSAMVAKQIFPKLRWRTTRPAIAISDVGASITSSTDLNGLVSHSSVLILFLDTIEGFGGIIRIGHSIIVEKILSNI